VKIKDLFKSATIRTALIILMVVLSYFPALRSGYIWDDDAVTKNLLLRTGNGLSKIWFHPSEIPQEAHYWPITYTTFWIEYHLWGLNPFGYHLVNVIIHSLNAILLWLILRHLFVPGAYFASMIFALHPVHIESVAWIIERKDVLSGFFYLLAFFAYINIYNRDRRKSLIPVMYSLSLFLFVCAMLSKSIVVSFPLAIIIFLWWKNGRLSRRAIFPLIPFFIIGVIITFLDVRFVQQYEDIKFELSFIDRCLIAGRAIWFYVGKLLLPINLMAIYPKWEINSGALWQYIFPAFTVASLIVLWLKRERLGKGVFALSLFFVITLGPILGFINYGFMVHSYVADRFQYLASIGLIVLFSAVTTNATEKLNKSLIWIFSCMAVLLLLLLGILTWRQTSLYKDVGTLFRYNIAKNPNAWSAYNAYGNFLLEQGKLEEAAVYYSMALKLNPKYSKAYYNIGVVFDRQGKINEAIEYYSKALQIHPNFAEAHNNLGNALIQQGKIEEAIAHYLKALQINPNFVDAHFNLANVLIQQGNLNEAIKHYSEALRINPDFVEGYINLGIAFVRQGKLDEAIAYFSKAVKMKPDLVEAYYNLGGALLERGKLEDAMACYIKVLETNPDDADVHYNLGDIFLLQGKIEQAIAEYHKTLQYKPGWKKAEEKLAKAQAIKSH